MYKSVVSWILLASVVFANSYTLDENTSSVYYEAKKEQFFMSFDIKGINKELKGKIKETQKGYEGNIQINALAFDSDGSKRDEHVKEDYLKANQFPYIKFEYTIEDHIARGIMYVAGENRHIEFPVKMRENDSRLIIEGSIKIKYSDFGIKTPANFILSADENLVIGANLNFIK